MILIWKVDTVECLLHLKTGSTVMEFCLNTETAVPLAFKLQ